MNPNKSSRGSRGRGSKGGGRSRGAGGSGGVGPSGGAGGSGFAGGPGFPGVRDSPITLNNNRGFRFKRNTFVCSGNPTVANRRVRSGFTRGRTRGVPRKTQTNLCKPRGPKRWTPEEEVTLVQAWINESENPVSGNAQRSIQFWKNIERSFYAQLGVNPYRTHHQLTTKWKAMNKKILAFNGIYNQIMNNMASGESDVNLLKQARSPYQMTESQVFPHETCWEILRHSPKWNAIPLMSGGSSSRSTKRTRTSGSSDAHFGHDSDEVEVPPPKRPEGWGKAKKALRGG
ncbi:hypothetical protein OSB04_029975 [Centaurea solstitialis]|uniref:Myb-like domain-containing protein n=1 Tax=Centaurea solstitialis TaxID=347529 RepID=A0AA38VW94_9ASTR|nr:hypothetical protein OSB04_029975 [Centaurea solstitialis]